MSDMQPAEAREQQIAKGNAPLYANRMSGSPVFVKLWENKTEDGKRYYTTSVGKTIKDPETGQVRDTASLSQAEMNQLPPLIQRTNQQLDMLQEQERSQTLKAQRDQAFSQTSAPIKADELPAQSREQSQTRRHTPEM